jgi:hypothetical protein
MLLTLKYGPHSREFEERYDIQYIKDTIAECKKLNTHIENRMIVVHVPFAEGAHMLQRAKSLMEETEEDGSGFSYSQRQVSQTDNRTKNCSS